MPNHRDASGKQRKQPQPKEATPVLFAFGISHPVPVAMCNSLPPAPWKVEVSKQTSLLRIHTSLTTIPYCPAREQGVLEVHETLRAIRAASSFSFVQSQRGTEKCPSVKYFLELFPGVSPLRSGCTPFSSATPPPPHPPRRKLTRPEHCRSAKLGPAAIIGAP